MLMSRVLAGVLAAVLAAGLSGCSGIGSDIFVYSQDEKATSRREDIEKPEVRTEMIDERREADYARSTPEESLEGVELSFASQYYMQNMTPAEQKVYKQFLKGVREFKTDIPLEKGVMTSDSFYDMVVMCSACQPDIDHLDLNYVVTIDSDGFITSASGLSYDLTPEEVTARNNELQAKVYSIMAGIETDWDDYDTYKYIHDCIVTGNTYTDEDSDCYTAYGCLVNGRSVCEGYSKAALLVCGMAGLDILPVMGRGISEDGDQGHVWDKIRLEGEWYVTDLTWDDPVIAGLEDVEGYICYDYFAITDELAAVRHEPEDNRYMIAPECTATEQDYYIKNGFYLEDMEDAPEVFRRSAMAGGDSGLIRVRCADREVYEDFCDWIYGRAEGSDEVFNIVAEVAEQFPEQDFIGDSYSVIDGDLTLSVTVELKKAG